MNTYMCVYAFKWKPLFLSIYISFFPMHFSITSSQIINRFSLGFHHFFIGRSLCPRDIFSQQERARSSKGFQVPVAYLERPGTFPWRQVQLRFAQLYLQGCASMDFYLCTFKPLSFWLLFHKVVMIWGFCCMLSIILVLSPSRCFTAMRRKYMGMSYSYGRAWVPIWR